MDEQAPPSATDTSAPQTGLTAVDAVIEDVRALAELPVGEHVAHYEAAHHELRRSLDVAPSD